MRQPTHTPLVILPRSAHPQRPLTRRAFARQTALGLAGAVGAPVLNAAGAAAGAGTGKRIGFVDLNLDNYHANVFLQALRGPLRSHGFQVSGCTGTETVPSRAWADKNAIPYFDRDEALNEAVDFYMVLAPSNPEVHRDLCRRVFGFKKPTYVDKTFAPNLATAREIFALADQHATPVQTTSALRYTNVQKQVEAKVDHMITWGGGSSFDEYAIHPLELLISVMGPDATALLRRGTPDRVQLLVRFTGDRTGVVNVYAKSNTPFAASWTTDKATRHVEVDAARIFVDTQAAILDFFEKAKPNIDRRESLVLMSLLDAARDPRAKEGFLSLSL